MDGMVRFASWTTWEIGCAMPKGSSVAKFELCPDSHFCECNRNSGGNRKHCFWSPQSQEHFVLLNIVGRKLKGQQHTGKTVTIHYVLSFFFTHLKMVQMLSLEMSYINCQFAAAEQLPLPTKQLMTDRQTNDEDGLSLATAMFLPQSIVYNVNCNV